MSNKAIDVAKYIIDKCTRDGKAISNLQLQKILYYVQHEYLINGSEAFQDEIEAWQFGPVVPSVYRNFCGSGGMPIQMEYSDISVEQDKIIDYIVLEKRGLDPWDMVRDTHMEGKAWSEIYKNGLGDHQIIPKELIKLKG